MNGLHLMYTCLRNYVESKKLQWKAGGRGGLVHDLKKIRQPSMRTCHVLWLIQAHRIRRSLENNTEEFTITNIYIHFKSRCLPLVSGFPWMDFAWQTFLLVHLFQLHLFLQLNFLWLCLNTALCEQSAMTLVEGVKDHIHAAGLGAQYQCFLLKWDFFCGRSS